MRNTSIVVDLGRTDIIYSKSTRTVIPVLRVITAKKIIITPFPKIVIKQERRTETK